MDGDGDGDGNGDEKAYLKNVCTTVEVARVDVGNEQTYGLGTCAKETKKATIREYCEWWLFLIACHLS